MQQAYPGDVNPGNAIQVEIAFDVPPRHNPRCRQVSREWHSEALVVCMDSFDDDDDKP